MKNKLPFDIAMDKAERFIEQIRPYCERVEVAGSLRRKKAEVGDIEIVCVPNSRGRQSYDLFGNVVETASRLEMYLNDHFHMAKNGPHYKQIELTETVVDLFITTPPQWGVIYTIRTGSADFSRWLVTWKRNGGALPSNMLVRDGLLRMAGGVIPTPEETDFFRALGLDWISPEERIEGRWRR